MAGRLDGQTMLVTGGGRGFGEHMSRAVAALGANVVIADLDADEGGRVAGGIVQEGGTAIAVATDVTEAAQVTRMVEAATERYGAVDVLLNNAGIAGPAGDFASIAADEWDQAYAVNVTGCFLCAQAVIPAMMARRSGHIVHISSGTCRPGIRAFRGLVYMSTKYAVEGLSYGLAVKLEEFGIRVNCIRPNIAATHFWEGVDRSLLAGARVWKPDHTVAPLLHLLTGTEATGVVVDSANWHESHGTAEAFSYVHE